MSSPQLIISLSPSGELTTELPGLNGARRKIPLQEEKQNNFTKIIEDAIECIKAYQTVEELRLEYNLLASKTTHVGSKGEKEKQLAKDKLDVAKLKIQNSGTVIAALTKILSSNELTTGIILQILTSQQNSKHKIGEDGNPTSEQVKHWRKHSGIFGDPSCPFCISEGKFEPGKNREDTRTLKGISNFDFLRLGLISRGFTQSRNNPDIWTKKNMDPIFLLPSGQTKNNKQVIWSKENKDALLSDGKIHAKTFGFTPQPIIAKYKGGYSVKRQVETVKETHLEKLQRKIGNLNF